MGAAKRYSAGTIFLQVIPVFDDVMKSIGREARAANKALGDEMERGGRDAGKRAGDAMGEELEKAAKDSGEKAGEAYIGRFQTKLKGNLKGVQRELDALNFNTLSDSAKDNFERVKRLAKDLDVEITADMDDKKVLGKLEFLRASLNELTKGKHELAVDSNLRSLLSQFDGAIEHIDKEVKKKREFHFGGEAELKQLERAMGSFEKKFRQTARNAADALGDSISREVKKVKARLDTLADSEIGIDISSEAAQAEMKKIEAELRYLSTLEADPGVSIDIASALAKIGIVNRAIETLDHKTAHVKVDVDTGNATARLTLMNTLLAAFRPRAAGVSSASENAANSFRSFNFVLLAAVTLLPALIPMIAAFGGGLLALLPIFGAVGAGLGTMLLGFSGIGDAVGALGDVQDNAAKDALAASKTMSAASNAVEDAQRGVESATRSAAQANADAARAVAAAKRAAADAIESALDRQREAAEAYRDSVQDVRDAEADLRQARKDAAAEKDDLKSQIANNALSIRQAQLTAFGATTDLNAVMADGASTNYDKVAAQLAYDQAQQQLKDLRSEQDDLAQAKKKSDREGINGSETVQTAQDALTTALEAQKDAQEAVGDAAEAVTQARIDGARSVAEAVRNQQRTEASGTESVEAAQRSLTRAQESYRDAVTQTGELGSASMQKLELAMGKLSPAGRKFARFLFGLRSDFYALRDGVQEAMLPGVQKGLENIIDTYGPQFQSFTARMGASLGSLFERAGKGLGEEPWREFFETYSAIAPGLMEDFAKTTGNWMGVYARLFTIVAPYAERLSDAMLTLSENALSFMESKAGADYWTRFMDYAAKVGPDVAEFFWNLARATIRIGEALAPWGEKVLKVLDNMLAWIAGMDTKILGQIAIGIIAVVVAMQAAVGVSSLVFAGASIFATAAGAFIFWFVLVAAAAFAAYQRFETFRNIVDSTAAFMLKHRDALTKVAAALGVVYAATKIYLAITKTVVAWQLGWNAALAGTKLTADAANASTKAYALAQARFRLATIATTIALWAQNAAWLANPVVLIVLAIIAVIALIVGAIYLLWTRNETFRRIVTAAWEKLKDVAESVFAAIVDALIVAWDYMQPVFEAIGQIVQWLWKNVWKRYFNLIIGLYVHVFKVMRQVWNRILWPVLDLIGHVVWKLWKTYFKVVFALIKVGWKVLVEAIKLYWKLYLHPLFKVIAGVVTWLWENVAKPTWSAMKDYWRGMTRSFKEAWDRWGAPLFKGIRETVLPKLKSAFKTTVEAIGSIWDGLKKIVGAPIKFVIETIINNGLVKGFNKIANFVGSDPMEPLTVPDWTQDYNTGGVMPGYTPGQDVHHFVSPTGGRLNLSGGESILRPEVTAAMGADWTHGLNAVARAEGVRGVKRAMGMNFSLGGILPGARIDPHDSYGHYAADFNVGSSYDDYGMAIHAYAKGFARAFDYGYDNSYGRGVVMDHGGGVQTLYAHMSRIAMDAIGKIVNEGTTIGYVGDYGNTGSPPTSHLHFEIGSGWNLPWTSSPGSSDGSYAPDGGPVKEQHSLPAWATALIGNPLDWAKGLIAKPVDALKDKFGHSGLIDAVAGMPIKLIKAVANKVVDIIPAKSAWDAAGHLLDSAGNTVGNIAGSVGGTISDGAGALGDALGFHRGGILPHNGTMMYDAGGYLPPGLTTVINATGKPEPVFTSDQFDKMDGEGGMADFNYSPIFQGGDFSSKDVADDVYFAYRRARRLGKYGKPS